MPFGLISTPTTFQRLIDKLFDKRKWPFVFTYLDDILIASIVSQLKNILIMCQL